MAVLEVYNFGLNHAFSVALSPGVKRPGLEVDHSPPTSAEVKIYLSLNTILELYSETALPRNLFGMGHMYKYNFLLRMTDTMNSKNNYLSF
jgi:hypothetical protein